MVTDALAQGFKETMWIDSDIAFDPRCVDRLRSHSLPISCGIYPKKGKRELAIHVMPGTEKIAFGMNSPLLEIRYAATGFLHVRREVYETVQDRLSLPLCNTRWKNPMLPFFQPMIHQEPWGSWYLAEDYAFCERVRQAGFQLFADPSFRLGHIGSYTYSWEEAGADQKRYGNYTFHIQ